MDLIYVTQDKVECWAVVNTVMNLQVQVQQENRVISRMALLFLCAVVCFVELVSLVIITKFKSSPSFLLIVSFFIVYLNLYLPVMAMELVCVITNMCNSATRTNV
jgi:hypothetical protein